MALEPKTEPGSLPSFISMTGEKGYDEMSISELVSVLRVAYQMEEFDRVEKELVTREEKLKVKFKEEIGSLQGKFIYREASLKRQIGSLQEKLVFREAQFKREIGSLHEKIELERLKSIEAEERLKIKEEQCRKGKQAQENYELLLKRMKNCGSVIDELRKKNVALEREVCELKEFNKIRLDDVKCVDELRTKIRKLEEEKVGDKSAIDVLNMKNTELKEVVEKNLILIESLRTKNDKLTDEKFERKTLFESLERKYDELRGSVLMLENDIKLLTSEDASDCGNTEVEPNPGVFYAVKDEEVIDDYELENDIGEPVHFPRTKDTHHHSLGTGTAQSTKKGNKNDASEMEIITLSDDDDDDNDDGYKKAISQTIGENEHPQRVETFTKKLASDIQTSSTSPSCDEMDNPPLKRAKT